MYYMGSSGSTRAVVANGFIKSHVTLIPKKATKRRKRKKKKMKKSSAAERTPSGITYQVLRSRP